MSFFAKLVKVDLEALGADPASIQGRLYLNTSTGVKWYDGSAWKIAADLDSSQTLSAKTFPDAKVSNYIDYTEVVAPSNPPANTQRLYAKSDGNIYKRDDTGTETQVGSEGGDSSFKLQAIASNNLTLKGGYLKLADGRELATYDGSNYGADLTVSLTTLQPTMGTSTWYLYIDIDSLGSEVSISGSGRKVYAITQSNMILSTTKPESINRARYAPLGTVLGASPNYSTTNFTTYAAKVHNNGPLAVSPKVYSLSQAVGSVGSASQIKGGHVLDAASFPSAMTASKASFFNLAADANDDSANARNLTNNGSTAFTGTNIFGSSNAAANLDGTDDNFSSSSTDLNPANSQSYGIGGWFKATDWTPASQKSMLSQANSGDLSFEVANGSSGVVFRATNTAGSFDATMTIAHSFVDGTWHHFAMVYDYSTQTLKAYIDGKLSGTTYLVNLRGASSANLRVGSLNGGDFFAGAVQDVFVVKDYLLTDADIRKLASTKLTHNASVDAKNQDWKFILGSGAQKHPSWQPVVDQSSSTVLYADFSDLESTETVDVSLLDMGMSAVAVPAVPPFDQTYTSNPTFPISHGLGEVPSLQVGYKDASNDWHWTTGEGAVRADSTQLKGSLQTFFDAAATQVRLRAVVGASPTGVKEATASAAGIVKGGTVPGATDGVAIGTGFIGNVQAFTGTTFNSTSSTPVVFKSFPSQKKGTYIFSCSISAYSGGASHIELRFRKTTGAVLVKNLHAQLSTGTQQITWSFPFIVDADQDYEITVHSSNASFQTTIEGNGVNQTGTVDAGQTYEITRIG